MPAKRSPKPAAAAETAGTPEPVEVPEPAEDGGNGGDASNGADASDGGDATAVVSEPLNRAERRAKAKGKTPSQGVTVRGKVVGSRGPASSQRMWANRRSG